MKVELVDPVLKVTGQGKRALVEFECGVSLYHSRPGGFDEASLHRAFPVGEWREHPRCEKRN